MTGVLIAISLKSKSATVKILGYSEEGIKPTLSTLS
jgi:hypothetical protein